MLDFFQDVPRFRESVVSVKGRPISDFFELW